MPENRLLTLVGTDLVSSRLLAGEVAINTPRSIYLYETMNHCALILHPFRGKARLLGGGGGGSFPPAPLSR